MLLWGCFLRVGNCIRLLKKESQETRLPFISRLAVQSNQPSRDRLHRDSLPPFNSQLIPFPGSWPPYKHLNLNTHHSIPSRIGRTAGGAYAGATAGHGTGASVAIGGAADGETGAAGGKHAEAHAFGKSKSVVQLYDSAAPAPVPQQPALVADEALDTRQTGNEIVVKKTVIKKKYVPEVSNLLWCCSVGAVFSKSTI